MDGGVVPTLPDRSRDSSAGGMKPRAVSTTATSWPRVRSAAMTWTAEARATSRSEDVPPVRTVIRIVTASR
jgi:hypothetical protein